MNPYTYPVFSLHEELQIFVEEALQAATINPSVFLKKDDELGTVEEGKSANLVLPAANPLKHIKNTQGIYGVVLRGQFYQGDLLRLTISKMAQKLNE